MRHPQRIRGAAAGGVGDGEQVGARAQAAQTVALLAARPCEDIRFRAAPARYGQRSICAAEAGHRIHRAYLCADGQIADGQVGHRFHAAVPPGEGLHPRLTRTVSGRRGSVVVANGRERRLEVGKGGRAVVHKGERGSAGAEDRQVGRGIQFQVFLSGIQYPGERDAQRVQGDAHPHQGGGRGNGQRPEAGCIGAKILARQAGEVLHVEVNGKIARRLKALLAGGGGGDGPVEDTDLREAVVVKIHAVDGSAGFGARKGIGNDAVAAVREGYQGVNRRRAGRKLRDLYCVGRILHIHPRQRVAHSAEKELPVAVGHAARRS